MFVLVVGGGKVGYYLTRELIQSNHEVVLMEKDRARANQIADEIGSVVIPHDGCEGKYLGEAGANRADIVAAVTGDDEDNLVICQMAKHHFDVPRTIARVNNPANEALFKHLGVDELISTTRMVLASIEQDIPVNELLHLAALGGGELELFEAHIGADSPAVGRAPRELGIPDGCTLFAIIRDGHATPLGAETPLQAGDKVLAIGQRDCEGALHAQLIGSASRSGSGSGSGSGAGR
jgi:trk system potassium uptake protein TrkA